MKEIQSLTDANLFVDSKFSSFTASSAINCLLYEFRSASDERKEALFTSVLMSYATAKARLNHSTNWGDL